MAEHIRRSSPRLGRYFSGLALCIVSIFVLFFQGANAAPTPLTLAAVGLGNAYTSIAVGTDGYPVMSYYAAGSNSSIMALHCTSADCSSLDSAYAPESGAYTGQMSSIAIGTDGYPVISYFDYTNLDLVVTHCTTANCSSWDTPSHIDIGGSVGRYTSIAIGTDGKPIISYVYSSTADLRVVHCTTANCSAWEAPLNFDTAASASSYTSIAIGTDGFPVIAYNDSLAGVLDAKLIHCTAVNCSTASAPVTLESANSVGTYASLMIGSDGYPAVTYYDATNLDLRFIHCTAVDCSTKDAPIQLDGAGGVNIGTDNSIAKGSDGYPIITYYDATNTDLKFIHCTAVNCSTRDAALTLDTAGGRFTDVTRGSDGFPVMSYFASSSLKFIHCTTVNCVDDTTAPTVSSVAPANGATSVAVTTDVTATFSESMDATTITGANFTLKSSTDDPVAATVGYDGPSKTATLNPTGNLLNDETYTGTVTTGAKDAAGNALASNYTFTFTTAAGGGPPPDTDPPATTFDVTPDTADGANGWFVSTPDISLSSDEAGFTQYQWNATLDVDWETGTSLTGIAGSNTLYFRSVDTSGNTEDTQSQLVRVDTAEPSAAITDPVGEQRLNGTTYDVAGSASESGDSGLSSVQVKIDSGSWTAATGTASWSYNWTLPGDGAHTVHARSFDSAGNTSVVTSVGVTVDNSSPTIDSTSPTDVSTDVSVTTDVSAIFSESMSPDSITAATFTLKSSTDDPVAASAVYESGTKTATLNPVGDLLYDETYTATVTTGAQDLAGNALSSAHTFTFTTASAPAGAISPPSAPVAWSHVLSSTQVKLYWHESTDDTAVVAYHVYESPSNNLLYTTTALSKTISGLTPGSTYEYYVKAEDADGEFSAAGNIVAVDTTAGGTTPAGSGALSTTVSPNSHLSITFEDVTAGGATVGEVMPEPPSGPNGYDTHGSVYDITTTSTFTGTMVIGLHFDSSAVRNAASVRLLHYSGGQWNDITTYVDTNQDIVFGETTSLSPFVAGEPSGSAGGWWKESTADPLGSAEWQSQVGNSTYGSPHGGFSTTSNLCKTCHAVHNSMPSSFRLLKNSSRSEECNYCHMGVSGLSKYRLYAFEDLGVPIKGEHSLGSTEVPDSTLIGQSSNRSVSADAETGELMSRGGPYDDNGKQQLYCYSCHSVHGANTITDALAGGWTRRILRINPGGAPGGFNANDGLNVTNATALGFSGLVRNDNTSSDSRALTPVKTLSTIRGVFCGSCHNRNFNFRENEDDGHDYSLQRASHPMGTDGTLDAGGGAGFTGNTKVSWQNVAWCGSCHASPVEIGGATPDAGTGYAGASGTDKNSAVADTLDWGTTWYASGFPHQSSSNKLLFESYSAGARDATQTNDAQEALSDMDSVCVRCHSEDGTFNPGVSGVGSSF